jgi:glycerol-3-phosphate acyltransferase PlsY
MLVAAAGLAAFIGHLFPVFHRFKGGKGVATAAGVLLGFNVWLGLGTLATWIVIAFFFRYSSLAALLAALFAPFFCWLLLGPDPRLLFVAAIGLLIIWRHSANISRLLDGTEPRLGAKKTAS